MNTELLSLSITGACYKCLAINIYLLAIVLDFNTYVRDPGCIKANINKHGGCCEEGECFLVIHSLPCSLPQILLHTPNQHGKYFQIIYSLLGKSMIHILHIRHL